MAGTKEGGRKTAITNKAKYGEDIYSRIGRIGGSAKVPKGFALMDKEKVSLAGQKGGRISRRGKAKPKTEPRKNVIKQIMEKIDVRLHQAQ